MNGRHQAGYTLIEVMIALVVFAIIAAISSGVLYHVFDIRKRVAIQANQLGELQLAATLLEHDLAQYVPRTVHTDNMQTIPAFVGTYQYMEFTRGGLANPNAVAQRSGLKRVAYVCQKKQLIRRSWRVLDTASREDYDDRVILSNLEACSFAYISIYQQIMPEWKSFSLEGNQKMQAIPAGVEMTVDPFGWGKIPFLFVIPEGLYVP
jgi:general secretion pathway protein J